jgi:crotonobetainyl-CoA:carnitine CoA-transferase CaiB-like acyl-CoA transferase
MCVRVAVPVLDRCRVHTQLLTVRVSQKPIDESVFSVLESVVSEYDGAGVVREPSGSTLTGIVPTNTYRCSDGKFVIIGGNGDSIYRRLMNLVCCRRPLGASSRSRYPER